MNYSITLLMPAQSKAQPIFFLLIYLNFYASLLIHSDKAGTLPLALQLFTEPFSYNYPGFFAALTVVVLPGILLYAVMEEQVQTDMASSGINTAL